MSTYSRRLRPPPRRRAGGGEVAGFFFLAACCFVFAAVLRGWLTMLAVGMIHGSVFADVPTISFGQGIILGIALTLLVPPVNVSADRS